jgi:hypothetical protein
MTQKPLEPAQIKFKLSDVREGMEVHDSQEHKIGTVREIYFGADSDEMKNHGAGAATAPDPSLRKDSLVDDLARGIFDADADVPEEMRQRLINEGFLRIDSAGLFKGDRYVLPEQIARVHENHIHLNVPYDTLLKR